MRSITTRDLRENLKSTFVAADMDQEVLLVPSTADRDDIFIVPAKVYNRMASQNQPISMNEVNGYLDTIDKEDSGLMKKLAE